MAEIDLIINATNKASGPIKQVTTDVDNLGKKVTSTQKNALAPFISSLGSAATLATGALAVGVGALGFAVAKTGIDFNNLKQQADIAFTTMLGSGEKAKVFLDDLQQFAAKTPFEFPELLSASQRLLAMGFAAEDVRPTLTAVGDAVAALGGSGELVGRVTTALGQMQAKGKASAEEMAQLTEAGIPGWKFLAEAIGTDVAGAMDKVSKGAVDADTVIDALVKGMNEDFGGMMEKQSVTFGGLVSTIKDTFTQVSGTVMAPFFTLITGGLQRIVDWTSKPEFAEGVQRFAENVQSFVESASTAIQTMVTNLSGTIGTIQGRITTMIGWIRLAWQVDWGEIRSTWEKFAAEMPAKQEAFWEEWNRAFNEGSNVNLNNWEDFWGNVFYGFFRWVTTTFDLVTTFLRNWNNTTTAFHAALEGDWETFWSNIGENFTNAFDVFLSAVDIFDKGFKERLLGSVQGAWDGLKSLWTDFAQWWSDTFGRLLGIETPAIIRPDLGIVNPNNIVPQQYNPGGYGGGSRGYGMGGNVTTGDINLYFDGPVSEQTLRNAGRTVRDELRAAGW